MAGASGVGGLVGLAGCSGDGGDGGSTSSDGESTPSRNVDDVQYGHHRAFIGAVDVPFVWAPREFIPDEYGYSPEINFFDESGVLTQAFGAGELNFATSSMINPTQLALSGGRVSMWGVKSSGSDYLYCIRTDKVDGIADFFESSGGSKPAWAIGSKGGNDHLQPSAYFLQEGYDPQTVNWRTIGGSGARTSAIAGGQVAGGLIHWDQWLNIKDEAPVENVGLAQQQLDGGWVDSICYSTPTWLENNQLVATDIIEGTIRGYQKAHNDFDWFFNKFDEWTEQEQDRETTRNSWELFKNEFGVWPLPKPLTDQSVNVVFDAAKATGLIPEDYDTDNIFTTEIQSAALDRIDGLP